MANPNADSEAAIVKTNKTKREPKISSKYIENKIKLKFTESNNNSIHIKATKIFFLFKINPSAPAQNIKIVNFKTKLKLIVNIIYLYKNIGIRGFEPLNTRTKNERLTTWLYSTFNKFTRDRN